EAEHYPRGEWSRSCAHCRGPDLEQLRRSSLDEGVATVATSGGSLLAGFALALLLGPDRPHYDESSPVSADVVARLSGVSGVFQILHRPGVGGLEAAQGHTAVPGRLAV